MTDSMPEQEALNPADEPESPKPDTQPDEGNALEQNPESEPADATADGGEPKKGEPDPKLARLASENRELKRRIAEREQAEQEARLQSLQRELSDPRTLDDFDGDQKEYGKYLAGLGPKQVEAQRLQDEQAAAAAAPDPVDTESWTERQVSFAETTPDFFEVVYDKSVPISSDVARLVYSMEDGPAVAYHLAKNPEVLESVNALPPEVMPARLRVLSKQLSGKSSETRVSKAPTPIQSDLGGGDVGTTKVVRASSTESDSLSTEEWMKRRNEEVAKRRKR